MRLLHRCGRAVVLTLSLIAILGCRIKGPVFEETMQFDCDTAEEVAPEYPIMEFILGDKGEFSVTWVVFESYVDYWGTYRINNESQTIEFTIDFGNYIREDFDGIGTFHYDDNGDLILTDIWFGTPSPVAGPSEREPSCGHRFRLHIIQK
jgi:hypothetical protein